MRRSAFVLFATTSIFVSTNAFAQNATEQSTESTSTDEVATEAATDDPAAANDQEIVITARKREETLKDVPVAATAITGDQIEKRGYTSVKEVAQLTPSLNINSDGAGRAFIAIRGVGTTLIDTVQPGVGIFVDGIYQPNTSYLNNPLTDVDRVEVLRGPQGTLYGKNTLGGAINVITRQPSNNFEGKIIGSVAGPDHAWTLGASLSGPIIRDRVQARVAFSHQQQDGFIKNKLIDGHQNPLNTDALSGTLRVLPADDVKLTINGYYTWVKGGAVPYAFVESPTDYRNDVYLNDTNYQYFTYRGVNAKLEFPVDALASKVTLIGAYDRREVDTDNVDPDFTPIDVLRQSAKDDLKTRTVELRFDSELSPTLSSIFGLFYSRETRTNDGTLTVLPGVFDLVNTSFSGRESDTYAVFGNIFWKPSEKWEVAAGLRWDKQKQNIQGLTVDAYPAALVGAPPVVTASSAKLSETNLSPRFSVTRHWNRDLMTYASVARGARGGGFNPPAVPDNLRTYTGDSVWTFELGSKYASPDRRFSLAGAIFYNDYKDYIGLNSIYGLDVGFTTIDLNTGHVESYGIELEGQFRPTPAWTISGGGSLMHARITDTDIYTDTTGRTLASNRLPFQPDWNFNLNSDYVIPIGQGDLTLTAGLVGKGSRIPASIQQQTPEYPGQPPLKALKSYVLTNAAITYRLRGIEVSAFVNNLFNTKYYESYIERTTLVLAGLPNSDVGIIGDKRRYGVRTRIKF